MIHLRKIWRIDVNCDALRGRYLSEILLPDCPVHAYPDCELADVRPSEVHLHWETVRRTWQVLWGYWSGSVVSVCDFSHQHIEAFIITISWLDERLWEVVQSHVEDDACWHSDLPTLAHSHLAWLEHIAVVFFVRRTSCASIALFDVAVSRTSISIGVVAIVTFIDELESVTTSFDTSVEVRVVVEFWSALDACVTVSTAQTASRTSNTLSVIVIKVAADSTRWRVIWTWASSTVGDTLSIDFGVAVDAFAEVAIPGRVGHVRTAVAKVSDFDSVTYTL